MSSFLSKLKSRASRVVINGRVVAMDVSGSIQITRGRVIINGKDVTDEETGQSKQISISIEGDVHALAVDVCDQITVNGNAGTVSTQTGDVRCGDVSGNVTTHTGDIKCKAIGGSASTHTGDIIKG